MSEPDTRTALSPSANPDTGNTAEWECAAAAADSAVSPDTQTLHTTPHEDGPDRPTGSAPIEPLPEPEERDSPDSLPQFVGLRVEKLLGLGGMGRVYRAVHVELNKTLAVKLITTMGRDEKTVRERFEREIRALAKLDHPNIVPIYDAGSWHGFLYFTMKYVPGGALSRHLDRFRASPMEAARLMAKVARAVDALHKAGIIHRDLKPLNILLGEDDEPLVADFGLAKWLDDRESDLTATHIPMGTRQYMSPEQTLGDRARYGVGCDIWALGVTLYEILAGGRPFADSGDSDIYEQIRTTEPPPLPETVPAGLAAIIQKCLAKRPEDRYTSAAALAAGLECWVVGDKRSVPPTRRFRGGLRAAGVVALLGVIAIPPILISERGTTPAVTKQSIADQLRDGETVTLIGEKGLPVVPTGTLPGCDSILKTDPSGACALVSFQTGTVELSSSDLPLPVRFEGEFAVVDSRVNETRAGAYVGRKETAGPKGIHQTMILFGYQQRVWQRPPENTPKWSDNVSVMLAHGIREPTMDLTTVQGKTIPIRPPVENPPLRWQRFSAVVASDRVDWSWNGTQLDPVFATELHDLMTNPNFPPWRLGLRFTEPSLGPGLGLLTYHGETAYRNVKLIPVSRNP